MEEWQKQHIQKSLVQLIKLTSCNSALISELSSRGVLTQPEVKFLERADVTSHQKAKLLYDTLLTRVGSYDILVQALKLPFNKLITNLKVSEYLQALTPEYEQIGNITYDKIHLIGQGNFENGSAKVCMGKFDNINVAVKLIDPSIMDPSQAYQDIAALRKLEGHENVIKYYGLQNDQKFIYVAMEPCLINLQDEIQIKLLKVYNPDVLGQCTRGLAYLHHNKITHLNLKPSNVLLTQNHLVKISDFIRFKRVTIQLFNFFRFRGETQLDRERWQAPEILKAINAKETLGHTPLGAEPSCDIYSLGCIYFYAWTCGFHILEKGYCGEEEKFIDEDQIAGLFPTKNWLHLIKRMIMKNPCERPTINQILSSDVIRTSAKPSTSTSKEFPSTDEKSDFVPHSKELRSANKTIYSPEPENILGKGSAGTVVYKGMFGNRHVAVKIITEFQDIDVTMNEINFLIKCDSHPNIVRYYAAEKRTNVGILLALELCQKRLDEWVEDKSVILPAKISSTKVLKDITSGLAYLHSKFIVHRDLKPCNILLFIDGKDYVTVKISDLGICGEIEQGRSDKTIHTGCGTSGWRSPEIAMYLEQLNGDGGSVNKIKMSIETDIFPLGCLFVYVLSEGQHPFGWSDRNILQNRMSFDLARSHLDIRTNSKLIMKMLSRNKRDRPDATYILSHPIFWTNKERLEFLVDISNFVEDIVKEMLRSPKAKANTTPVSNADKDPVTLQKQACIELLEKSYKDEICQGRAEGWFAQTCPTVEKYLKGNHRTKNYFSSVILLIRVIRNMKNHFEGGDLDENVKTAVGNIPDEYMTYWMKRFPLLIEHTRNAFEIFQDMTQLHRYYERE